MGHRLGFVLSLLAACGIHAVVLLVPRAPITEKAPIPTIALDLAAAPVHADGPPAETRATAPRAAAVRTERETQPAPAEAVPLEASRPSVPIEPPAAAASVEQSVASFPASPEPAGAPSIIGSGAGPASEGDGASETSSPAPSEGAGGAASRSPAAAPTGFIPPRPLAEILPTYPLSARRSGFEGVVKVTAMVDASGNVTGTEVLTSSGHASLDQAVLEAVRRALFSPALQDGKPVPCRIVIPIRFQLSVAAHG